MILDNEIAVRADPLTVFALLNDVERVATCLPGAVLEGRDGEAYVGRVKVRVGPITVAYSGTVRFLETDQHQRRLRLHAVGVDVHGSGGAEAEVTLTVSETDDGALLLVHTDLVIGGKIVQFGKGAIGAVADKILRQFAANLAGLLDSGTHRSRTNAVDAKAADLEIANAAGSTKFDGLSLTPGPVTKHLSLVAAFAFGLFHGWLLGKLKTQGRALKEMRRG